MTLSDAARSAWAKTGRGEAWAFGDGAPLTHWLPLHQHLSDAAGIAARLWDEGFWAPKIRARLAQRYGGNEATARALAILIAENHDVGKASPAFAAQCAELTHEMAAEGLKVRQEIADHPDRSAVRHELLSYVAFLDWVEDRGSPRDVGQQLASVLGMHHGRPLLADRVRFVRGSSALAGEGLWKAVRNELLDRAANNAEVVPYLEQILATPLRKSDLVLLSGMLVLTDWIASSEAYFPLFELESNTPVGQEARVAEAWRRFSPAPGWHPGPVESAEQLFGDRFKLPKGASIHPVQRQFAEAALTADEPKLMILEAPMGSGKTEAALAAAEILAARFGSQGLFVALPTQATSDAMFSRVREWADRAGVDASIFLAHGRSALNDEFETLWEDPRFNGVNETGSRRDATRSQQNDDSVFVHRWFADSKKGPFSDLVVGTIDQLLFLALQSRHVALRHLALAGKVVVIDEAHAFDVYMGEFLTRAVQWLGAYGVPTIILSATLPSGRRQDLVRAYEEGQLLDRGEKVRQRRKSVVDTSKLGGNIGYPAIVTSSIEPEVRNAVWIGREQQIEVERIGDDLETLVAALRDRMSDGGCVAVIRNVVKRAREAAEYLQEAFPEVEVILAHSRFMAEDRARRDRYLLDKFGSPSRATERPKQAIVVATQVIEQSLDLDFDLIVSDIAPIDLLLQRTGRLHRHERFETERPASMRAPRLILTGVDWGAEPPDIEGGSRAVYGDHLLLRTMAELEGRDRLVLPRDIAPLVQRVYSDEPYSLPVWQEALTAAKQEFTQKREKYRFEADSFRLEKVTGEPESLLGWANFSVGDAEGDAHDRKGRAMVRRTGESLEIYVLYQSGGVVRVPSWWDLGGEGELPLNEEPNRGLQRAVMRSVVRISEGDCQKYGQSAKQRIKRECRRSGIDLLIEDLEELTCADARLDWLRQTKELRGEFVVVFDENGRYKLPSAVLRYSETGGLWVEHDEG